MYTKIVQPLFMELSRSGRIEQGADCTQRSFRCRQDLIKIF